MEVERTLRAALALLAVGIGTAGVLSLTATGLFASPLTVALVVFSVGLSSLAALIRANDELVVYAGYAIAVSYSLVSLFYLLGQLEVGALGRSVVLIAVSVVLLGVVYAIDAERTLLTENVALGVAVGVVLVTVVVGGVDVTSDEPRPVVTVSDSPEPIGDSRQASRRYGLGEVTVDNPSVLPQRSEDVVYAVCISDDIWTDGTEHPERPLVAETRGAGAGDIVFGETTGTIETRIPSERINESRLRRADVIVTERCPDRLENGTVAVYPR